MCGYDWIGLGAIGLSATRRSGAENLAFRLRTSSPVCNVPAAHLPEFYAPPFAFRRDFPCSFAGKGVTVSSKPDEGRNRAIGVDAISTVEFHVAPDFVNLLKHPRISDVGLLDPQCDMKGV